MGAPRLLILLLSALAFCSLSCNLAASGAKPSSLPPAIEAEVTAVAHFLGGRHTGLTPEKIAEVAEVIVSESRGAGLSPALVVALIHVESSGYSFAVSRAGALGLMQLRPATAEAEAQRIGVPWKGPATLFDPVANVRLGVSYLARLLERHGSVKTALAAYNWGPTRIAARVRRGEDVPSGYAQRVLASSQGALSPSDLRI
jgi:soluble lytic murein transglycosylase-like protein